MLVRVLNGNAPDGSFIIPEDIHITRREIGALVLVANGIDNQDAAKKFGVSVNTFRNHVFNVMQKLDAHSRAHAIVLAIQNGIIEVAEKRTMGNMTHDNYYLCIFCERAFNFDEVIEVEPKTVIVNHVQMTLPPEFICPYEGCNGWATYGVDWKVVRKDHPEYPEIPEKDKVYDFDLDKYLRKNGFISEVIKKDG